MEQPIVSVIIPVYNCEEYLRQCLDSVKNQTLKNIEIICVDDGSSDNSPQILNEYAQKDNRFIILSQQNAGAGAARNNGLKIAKGKYLSFLDSDDFFELTMLEKAVEKISADKADFVVFKCDQFLNDTKTYRKADYTMRLETLPPYTPFGYRAIAGNIFKTFVGWAWDKLYDREFVLKNNLTFQEQRTSNDMRFVFTALVLAKKITYITDILAHQRRNNGSSLSNTREKSWFCFYNALTELRTNLKNAGIYKELERDYINYALHFSLWNINTIAGDCFYKLYDKLKNEWFEDLGIKGKSEDYFYDKNEYRQYADIMQYSADEYKTDLSVIVNVDNCKNGVEKCLDSILKQNVRSEIICTGTNPDEKTEKTISDYISKHPQIKTLFDNSGKTTAEITDKAVETAKGQYVHFIDGSDVISDKAYEKLVRLAKKKDLDCLKGASTLADADTQKKIEEEFYSLNKTDGMLNENLWKFKGFPKKMFTVPYEPWNGIYKKKFLIENSIKFSDRTVCGAHAFYISVCMKSQRFMTSKTKLATHYINENHYRKKSADTVFEYMTQDCKMVEQLVNTLNIDDVTRKKILRQEYDEIISWYNEQREKNQIDKQLEDKIQAFLNKEEKIFLNENKVNL